jgi:hypothetical protein
MPESISYRSDVIREKPRADKASWRDVGCTNENAGSSRERLENGEALISGKVADGSCRSAAKVPPVVSRGAK